MKENNSLMRTIQRISNEPDQALGRPTVSSDDVIVPGYDIVREIFRGGQGVIYEAVQTATNRTVALKLLLAGSFATSRQRNRFELEVDLVAGLRHPNIVTVYDSGTTKGGRRYLAMEHIEGASLSEYESTQREQGLRSGGEGERRTLKLFMQIAGAISYAHQRGIIHRDIKPANVIVDAEESPHVVDFGLAKNIRTSSGGNLALTKSGEFMGTLLYASPEHVTGNPELLDVRSDIYALGVMLYEMLTGRLPYPADAPLDELVLHISRRPPAPMVAIGGGAVADDLQTIVATALAKDKQQRYQSVEAFQQDIHRYERGEPIEAKRDRAWYMLRMSLRRYRAPAAVLLLVFSLLAVFGTSMSVLYQRSARESAKLRQLNIFLQDTLGSVDGSDGHDTTVRDVVDEAVMWLDILSNDPENEASLRNTIGNTYRNLGRLDEAEEQLERALEIRQQIFHDGHPEVASSLNSIALLRLEEGRFSEAEDLLLQGLEIRKRSLGTSHPDVAQSVYNIGRVRIARRDAAAAENYFRESMALRRAHFGDGHPDVSMARFQIASSLAMQENYEEAEAMHERVLRERRTAIHPEHPDIQRSLLALADVRLAQGDSAGSESALRECLSIRVATFGDNHWKSGEAKMRLGSLLTSVERYDEAETNLLDAYEALESGRGTTDAMTLQCRADLRTLYVATNDLDAQQQWQ
jgi:serine/threonine-protein kinase